MNWNIIAGELATIAEIIDEWRVGAQIAEIDRDLVLDKLRAIYGEIKFFTPAARHEPAVAVEPKRNPEPVAAPAKPEPDLQATAAPAPAPVEPERKPEPAPVVAPVEPVSVPKSEPIDEPAPQAEVPARPDEPSKHKIDRKALLSLYDDCSEAPAAKAEEPVAEPLVAKVHLGIEENVRVLGEVIGNGSPTVGDMIAMQNPTQDVASRIGSAPVGSLSDAIGINDKFLMIRDLFDSDPAAYDRAMEKFESFTDLDDAMVYIYENYAWNPGDEAVKLLVDILTRKLS